VFTLKCAAGGQDFVGQMFGRVGTDCFIVTASGISRFAAPMTEFGVRRNFSPAVGTDQEETKSALLAKVGSRWVFVLAAGAGYCVTVGMVAIHIFHPN